MKICFITQKYPGKHNQSDYSFVKQLVDAIAAQGNDCYVVCPFNVFHYHTISSVREDYSVGKGKVSVFRPWYYSFSNKIRFLGRWGSKSHQRALQKAFSKLPALPDVIYGHFWHSAYKGYAFAKKHEIPLFVASGESEIRKLFTKPVDLEVFREYVSGVICVSSKNRDESISMGFTTIEKCGVFPNGVNVELFHKRDKGECRRQLELPQNEFIVAFVGWFNERKGSLRVAEAINRIGGVKSIFIGKGEQDPQCDGILFKGALPHNQVPLYLGAADCFVLPTRAEGCCNAVVEAMACGLPVISSNLPFNWDVLDETNSIMVDPENIDEIAHAIKCLHDDVPLRERLAAGALRKAESLTIDQRAKAIVEFIKTMSKR
jgi:glycosyltransferase involved in cell wall biosynthesis